MEKPVETCGQTTWANELQTRHPHYPVAEEKTRRRLGFTSPRQEIDGSQRGGCKFKRGVTFLKKVANGRRPSREWGLSKKGEDE